MSGGSLDRETEHWILHELPFARAMCYLHAYWSGQSHVWTVELGRSIATKVASKVENILERVRKEGL